MGWSGQFRECIVQSQGCIGWFRVCIGWPQGVVLGVSACCKAWAFCDEVAWQQLIIRSNGLARLAESLDKWSHPALVAPTVKMLFQNFRFDDFDMHHQGLAPSKCHACRKRFCKGSCWSVRARGRPIKTPCMEFHQNRCFPKVPA